MQLRPHKTTIFQISSQISLDLLPSYVIAILETVIDVCDTGRYHEGRSSHSQSSGTYYCGQRVSMTRIYPQGSMGYVKPGNACDSLPPVCDSFHCQNTTKDLSFCEDIFSVVLHILNHEL